MSIQSEPAGKARMSVSLPMLLAALALLAVVGLVGAVKTWGLVALGLVALATVPFIFLVLIIITLGK